MLSNGTQWCNHTDLPTVLCMRSLAVHASNVRRECLFNQAGTSVSGSFVAAMGEFLMHDPSLLGGKEWTEGTEVAF